MLCFYAVLIAHCLSYMPYNLWVVIPLFSFFFFFFSCDFLPLDERDEAAALSAHGPIHRRLHHSLAPLEVEGAVRGLLGNPGAGGPTEAPPARGDAEQQARVRKQAGHALQPAQRGVGKTERKPQSADNFMKYLHEPSSLCNFLDRCEQQLISDSRHFVFFFFRLCFFVVPVTPNR